MKSLLLAATALGIVALAPMSAHAGFIAAGSELSLDGTDTYTTTSMGGSNSITFLTPAGINGTPSSSFAELADCASCVTMDTATLTSANIAGATLFSAADTGGFNVTLTAVDGTFVDEGGIGDPLRISGDANVTLTGFLMTPATYAIDTSDGVVTFELSVDALAVPEPGSVLLLGMGLLGLALVARRRDA